LNFKFGTFALAVTFSGMEREREREVKSLGGTGNCHPQRCNQRVGVKPWLHITLTDIRLFFMSVQHA